MDFSALLNRLRDGVRPAILIGLMCLVVYAGQSFSCTKVGDGFNRMQPAFKPGQVVFIDKRPARAKELHPGDVICYDATVGGTRSRRVGRIIAMPGEVFEVDEGQVIVDGEKRTLRAAASVERFKYPRIMVPANHVLVIFDKPASYRSNLNELLVPFSEIRGRIPSWLAARGEQS